MKNLKLIKLALPVFIIAASIKTNGQDTAAIIAEYNKVMSFMVKPHLYYKNIVKSEASIIMQPQDTGSVVNEVLKNGNSVYSVNRQEILFMDDSLYTKIDEVKKTIWISRLSDKAKQKNYLLPLEKKELQQIFRNRFIISKTAEGKSVRLNFVSRSSDPDDAKINITVSYSREKFLPETIETAIEKKLRLNDDLKQVLNKNKIDYLRDVVMINNSPYLLIKQKVTVQFDNIDNSPKNVTQVPGWKSVMNYNSSTGIFTGKGNYSSYEITKTF